GMDSPSLHIHFNAQLISWSYRAPKARLLNSGEYHQLFITVFDFGQQQRAARLGDRFYDQNPGHDGQIGKMTSEKRFIHRDILDGHDPRVALQVDDSVNQQEREAVRQDTQNVLDIHGGFGRSFHWSLYSFCHFLPKRPRLAKRRLYCTANEAEKI